MDDGIFNAESIRRLYDRLYIPDNLRTHMFRVASVVELIHDHWKGEPVDFRSTVAAALLHDLGNIVRFNLDSETSRRLMGDSVQYWKGKQKEAIARYGSEEHAATLKMMDESGIDGKVRSIVREYNAIGLSKEAGKLEAKVCEYADARVGAYGVVSVAERFSRLRERRRDSILEIMDQLEDAAISMEREVLSNTDLSPEGITDASIAIYLERYGGS